MDWRALESGVDGIIGASFGEGVRLSFMANGRPDPSRLAIDVKAILHVEGDVSRTADGSGGYATRVAAGMGELVIDRSKYIGPPLRQGDKVRASDRAGAPWFEVATVHDRFSNIIVYALTQI